MPETDLPAAHEFADLGELTTALAAAQGEFPEIRKSKTARVRIPQEKGGGEYTYQYADIADVLAAVRPVLSKHKLAIVQRTKPGAGKTLLLTELRHTSGQILDSEVELTASPGNPQQFGAMLTYLRRYEAVTLLGIAAEEDTDAQHVEPVRNGNGGGQQAPAALPAWARPASHNRIHELGEALIPIMGATRARRVAASVKSTLGEIPDVVVATAKLIGDNVGEALESVGPEGALAEFTARLEQEQADLEAQREADQADRAAEAGDPPAEDPPEGYGGAAEDLAEAEAKGAGEPAAEQEEGDGSEGIDHQAAPAPGTVEKPELEEGESESDLRERFEQAGCTCPDPLAPDEDKSHDERCPIKGHGIPF